MDFRNFLTHAAERRRAGAIFGSPPPIDGKRTGVHHWRIKAFLRVEMFSRRHNMDQLFSEEPFISECLQQLMLLLLKSQPPKNRQFIGSCQHYRYLLFEVEKGLLFEGKKFTLKFQWKCGISSWPCSTGDSCKAIASVEVKDNDSHIIKISDHNKSLLLKLLTNVPLSSHVEIVNNLAASCY